MLARLVERESHLKKDELPDIEHINGIFRAQTIHISPKCDHPSRLGNNQVRTSNANAVTPILMLFLSLKRRAMLSCVPLSVICRAEQKYPGQNVDIEWLIRHP